MEPPTSAMFSMTTICSLILKKRISSTAKTSICVEVTLPRQAPYEIRTAAAAKSPRMRSTRSMLMRVHGPPENAWAIKPWQTMCSSMHTTATSIVTVTADSKYLRRNVMRNPNPTKIITWTSCRENSQQTSQVERLPCSTRSWGQID
eukprot:scaffold275189_cov47-Prasinocladus_malaysianus.AAC.1